jgi:hypothetical protein
VDAPFILFECPSGENTFEDTKNPFNSQNPAGSSSQPIILRLLSWTGTLDWKRATDMPHARRFLSQSVLSQKQSPVRKHFGKISSVFAWSYNSARSVFSARVTTHLPYNDSEWQVMKYPGKT